LDGYSIAGHLLFDVVALTPNAELSPFEKLFVARNAGIPTHQGYLEKVFRACGCLDQLEKYGSAGLNSRERGDLAWAKQDFIEAERCYSEIRHPSDPERTGPHDDRLLRLALVREQWELVVRRFVATGFMRGFTPGTVIPDAFEVPARPILQILAVALNKLKVEIPAEAQLIIESVFR
jgi:hypothetical protein